jgi:endonuclease/exonuclease/phosphatase family metal-dependent hydrolase
MFKIIKYSLCFVLVLIASFCGFIGYMTYSDYTPAQKESIISDNRISDTLQIGKPLKMLTWNIGYAGLDSAMDFFYDGGHQVRPTESQVLKNMHFIGDYLSCQSDSTDFMLIEEIDKNSKRSYYRNQIDTFIGKMEGYKAYFAKNYSVKWVPIPITDPMGSVESGVALLTNRSPISVTRYAFPFNFDWPLSVFMLDRCFLCNRYPTSDGKQLVLIVTHNSAFDSDGHLRKAELNYFKKFLLREYAEGNYVIAGGDYNQCPAKFDPCPFGKLFNRNDFHTIPDSLFPSSWHFVYDGHTPSNREVIAPYHPNSTKVTVIDFFITSPNVKTIGVKTDNLEFSNSDHNPVRATFVLEGN